MPLEGAGGGRACSEPGAGDFEERLRVEDPDQERFSLR